ncbi:MAG TPA: glycosyltransferase [Azoarcus taiwanensis]|nr:glycosyltransferase [Azoarcus taiwanensis]
MTRPDSARRPHAIALSPPAKAISVIVPIYNDWHLVPTLLDRLGAQHCPQQDFEVLLTDNGSDSIPPLPDLPANARILHCEHPGSYAARNHAIAHARGRILAFTDADCRPSPHWLSSARRLIEDDPRGELIIAGAVRIVPADTGHPNTFELFDMALGIPQQRYARLGFGVTANLFVTRDVVLRVGGFDAARFSGGDAELCHRATANGVRLVYHGPALVDHPARSNWAEIASKARRIKGGQICTGSRRTRAGWALRSFVPPLVSWFKVLSARQLTLAQRLAVCTLHGRLWVLGIHEMCLLLAGIKKPER